MTKDYYSATEVANILKISRITVSRWIKKGEIKAIQVGHNFVIPYESIVEKLGKKIGEGKKAEVEKTIDKAMKEYEKTFRKLGKE